MTQMSPVMFVIWRLIQNYFSFAINVIFFVVIHTVNPLLWKVYHLKNGFAQNVGRKTKKLMTHYLKMKKILMKFWEREDI